MATTYQINKLSDASPTTTDAAVDVIDTSIQQVQDALNNLSERVDNLNQKSAVVRQHVPLASGVLVGDLVYYKAYNDVQEASRQGEYDKALAVTLAETQNQGQSIEAPSARVEGIVIATDPGSSPLTGTLLIGGYWEDATVTASCLGASANPGVYYLSPVNAGKGTLETNGHLRQPVLSYYGNGQFSLSLFYMAHDNHFHSSQVLGAYWTGVSGTTVSGRPAYFQYTGDYAAALGEIGDTTAVFYDGLLVNTKSPTSLFVIDDDKLYYMDGTSETGPDKEVVLFNHYPFAYENAVVRTVYSTNDALTVTNTNGNVAITGNDFIQGVTAKSSQAIYSINGRELNYTPVVTDIAAGPGIGVSRSLDGTAIITAANSLGGLMDAYSVNHNGTTLISDASNPPFQYITFPAGRYSEYVMYLPIDDIGDTVCSAAVWLMKVGTTAPTFTVRARYIPAPTADNPTSLSDLPLGSAELRTTGGTTATSLVYNEATIPDVEVSQSGMLVAVVGCTTGSQISLLRTGFKLTVNAEGTAATMGTTETMDSGITQTLAVAPTQTIYAGDAVMVINGQLVICTNQKNGVADNTNKCVGIAMSNATAGQDLTYMITGTMTLAVSDGEPGDSLYINEYGKLEAVSDVDAFMSRVRFLQKVGTILTGNKIQVNIESAVRGNAQ